MKHPSVSFDPPSRTDRRFASIAKVGVATALAALVLAIIAGTLGLDRDGAVGTLVFPALGVVTLLGGVGAALAGLVAIFGAHDRSVGIIGATVAGALLGLFMVVELFIEG